MDVYRLTPTGLMRWRALAGQAGVDAWCRLHGLDPNRTKADLSIQGGTVTAREWVEVDGRRTGDSVRVTRALIAPPHPRALELAS